MDFSCSERQWYEFDKQAGADNGEHLINDGCIERSGGGMAAGKTELVGRYNERSESAQGLCRSLSAQGILGYEIDDSLNQEQ